MKNKKASLTERVIVALIITSIVLIVVIANLNTFSKFWNYLFAKENCKNSVKIHAVANVQNINFIKEINCPTQYITIKGSDPEKLKREIADEMYTCWDNFGQGKYELFSAKTDHFCVVCFVIDFEKKNIKLTDFNSFLKDNYISGREKTYFQFLANIETNYIKDELPIEKGTDTIDTKYKYAVSFLYAKQSYWSKLKSAGIGAAIGAGVGLAAGIALIATGVGSPLGVAVIAISAGGVVGAGIGGVAGSDINADWQAATVLWPYDQMDQLDCTYLPAKQDNK